MCCYRKTFPCPPPSCPSIEALSDRGRGVFSLRGHIPLNRLPSFSPLFSFLLIRILRSILGFFSPSSSLNLPTINPFIYSYICPQTFLLLLPLLSAYLPFHSSSIGPSPLQPCIIRPKHKPVQAHIWKEFRHGSFLPRRLNI